jgi:hypothetical protein
MLAWAAKRKLVKLAKACLPRPRAEQPFGRGNDVTLAIQVAAQIGSGGRCGGRLAVPGVLVSQRPARGLVSGRAISIDGPSAVDEQVLTGDVARRVAGQEHNGSIELVEPRGPAQRRVALYPCHLLWVAEKS